MKKFISFIGFTAAAVVSSTVVYLYLNDKEVHEKVDNAVSSVSDAVTEIKRSIELNRLMKESQKQDSTQRNQAWVDEQWEALGI